VGSQTTIVRAAELSDSSAIAAIYNHYISETVVTFEEVPVQAAEIARRIADVQSVSLPWLVAEENSQVVGYAYATPWKTRSSYCFSVEVTVYVALGRGGRGIGSMFYRS
jgi:L-amino acid N-acyltransferase YncA